MSTEDTQTIEKEEVTEQTIEDKIKSDYDALDKNEIIKMLQNRDARLHEVNEESKSRKLKLREYETKQEQLKTQSMKEKEEYKALYDDLVSKTANYNELTEFQQKTVSQWEAEAESLEGKLTETDATEYDLIKDSLDISKKLKYLKIKTNKQVTPINIDSTKSNAPIGSNGTFPTTIAEMNALNSVKLREFKDKRPADYQKLMMQMANQK